MCRPSRRRNRRSDREIIGVFVVLSKREKYIGIGTIAAIAFLGINSLIIGPYYARSDELTVELKKANQTLDDNQKLFRAQKDREPQWNAMLNNGLRADDSTALSRTQQMLQTWARTAGFQPDALSSERAPAQKGPFEAVNFSVDFNTAGNDSMRQIAKFLWSIESATIPIRLNSIRIQSTREGTDQLNVKLVVSALYMPIGPNANLGNDVLDALEGMQ
jgi:hypothetical protein